MGSTAYSTHSVDNKTFSEHVLLCLQDVNEMVTNYNLWLREDAVVPKLYIDGDPGFFSAGIRRTVSSWPNVRRVKAKGLHFLQEDDPHTIGKHVAQFVQGTRYA